MDIYIRVSQLGDRSEEEATEVYEAQCREWADRHDIEVDEVVEDTDVSGARAVAERGLEQLIRRVEEGESDGILTPYVDRFGRDLIEGAVAYRRIRDADGRLVCVRDGLDSDSPGGKTQFNLRLSFAEDALDRVKENWNIANERMIEQGRWHAPKIPFGYRKTEERKLEVVDDEAAVVRELYRRRARGENYMSLQRWMRERCARERLRGAEVSRSGVRRILANEVYLGTTKYARGRQDNPIVKRTHASLVTPAEWESAQIKRPFSPRTGRASNALLRGLVYCASCGHRCKVGASPRAGADKVPTYICTHPDCPKHAGIMAARLDGHVDGLLIQAAADREPHVEAILLGDTKFQDALAAVEEAKDTLAEYRDNVEAQRALGMRSWTEGLTTRKEALELARREMRRARPTTRPEEVPTTIPWEQAERMLDRARFQQYVAKVVVSPTPDGRPQPAEDRAEVYFIGASEPYRPEYADVQIS